MKYVNSPELATVGQSPKAYLQRFVAITLGLICVSIGLFNMFGDCRVVAIRNKDSEIAETGKETLSNFASILDNAFSAFGEDGDGERMNQDVLDNLEAIYYGLDSFALITKENSKKVGVPQCLSWDSKKSTVTAEDVSYYGIARRLAILGFVCGMFGVVCAMVEYCFLAFYPSVIVGAIFFMFAAILEATVLLMMLSDLRECFVARQCFAHVNFYLYCFNIGAYIFSSFFLIFGYRTYPLCLKHNRDPGHCKVVAAEILSFEEIHKLGCGDTFDEESKDFSPENYRKMKKELEDTKKQLEQSEQEKLDAIARAKIAENMVGITNNSEIDIVYTSWSAKPNQM